MAFDSVPLAIGNGALHSDDVWRVAANAFSRDSQGIVLPGQYKVTALGTPGAAVTIATGGAVIRNAQSPGQSYVGRAGTTTQVAIAPNNTASTRRDLIIGRIIDPDFAPWQPSGTPGAPNVDVASGPYWEPFVVSGVASNVTRASQVVSYSAVALARIDIPANTTAITQAMIVDCRELAQPRVGFAYDVQTGPSVQSVLVSNTTFFDWPTNSLQLYVPRWATHAQASARFLSIKSSGLADMNVRVVLGGTNGPNAVFDNNEPSGTESVPFAAYGEFNVTAVQDSMVTLKTQAQRTAPTNTGTIYFDTRQFIEYDVKFSERVI